MAQLQPRISLKNPMQGYVALGSNLSGNAGGPKAVLTHSLKLFAGESIEILQQSYWYRSAAFPAGSGPDYVNAVVEISSDLGAAAVLAALHRIEAETGRVRGARWGARVCDLDLLAYGDLVCPDLMGFRHWFELPLAQQKTTMPEQLILPHPRIQDRAFVLVPFDDIAPGWRHPVLGKTVARMKAELSGDDLKSVQRISL
ncbi:MAG: 2-amino-4-hydroxy-6-hydroxymethyldihydropteridine diphosphokinase [Rhodobacteraceae bacterium]|nr:2-amino-4-hydroxy-6-hydroxymethyldihydropteridine diphosphokinase [Paracoccaceae bacterium]